MTDLDTDSPRQAFEADLRLGREYGASGFPTLLFLSAPQKPSEQPQGILVNGHRPYQTYVQVLNRLAPGLAQREPRPIPEVLMAYGPLTTRELAEITGQKPADIVVELSTGDGEGRVERIDVPHGEFWKLGMRKMNTPTIISQTAQATYRPVEATLADIHDARRSRTEPPAL